MSFKRATRHAQYRTDVYLSSYRNEEHHIYTASHLGLRSWILDIEPNGWEDHWRQVFPNHTCTPASLGGPSEFARRTSLYLVVVAVSRCKASRSRAAGKEWARARHGCFLFQSLSVSQRVPTREMRWRDVVMEDGRRAGGRGNRERRVHTPRSRGRGSEGGEHLLHLAIWARCGDGDHGGMMGRLGMDEL
ncbi:hypothetical protein BC628DRAFT_1344291 [Trametes gibbosa]|nr:hypothetical protein BC628DRAFT_1344291 [Trametes gibbosa]